MGGATREAEDAGIRVVHLRLGIVLSPAGGALGKLLPVFRVGLGGKLGNGRQWMSWITLDDTVNAILHAVGDESTSPALALRGPVNVCSPEPVTNSEFTSTLGKVLRRPALLPVPAFALRLGLGQMADEALLSSARVLPSKLMESGFSFKDPSLEAALHKLLR